MKLDQNLNFRQNLSKTFIGVIASYLMMSNFNIILKFLVGIVKKIVIAFLLKKQTLIYSDQLLQNYLSLHFISVRRIRSIRNTDS